ncbi:hypothetical protein A0H81_14819 [Grifola frondosa]|uniref:Uncharacterized protein n=1 Tax=Grifola frondosa TaxID=5627 RepID=A0A1C7LK78_GRIFR|nr:hypothetical protein A0H81_14819 [Grifola frondosa]
MVLAFVILKSRTKGAQPRLGIHSSGISPLTAIRCGYLQNLVLSVSCGTYDPPGLFKSLNLCIVQFAIVVSGTVMLVMFYFVAILMTAVTALLPTQASVQLIYFAPGLANAASLATDLATWITSIQSISALPPEVQSLVPEAFRDGSRWSFISLIPWSSVAAGAPGGPSASELRKSADEETSKLESEAIVVLGETREMPSRAQLSWMGSFDPSNLPSSIALQGKEHSHVLLVPNTYTDARQDVHRESERVCRRSNQLQYAFVQQVFEEPVQMRVVEGTKEALTK